MRKVLILLVVVILFNNCERDDICAESTLTTPVLVIDFNDDENLDNPKNVRRLRVEIFDESNNVIAILNENGADENSISLPLRVQDENTTDPTTMRYALIKDFDFENDNDDSTSSNTDIIEVTYTTEFIYVSRACGFKSIFNLETPASEAFEIINDDDTWTTFFSIETFTIENSNEAHIIIYH